MLEIFQRHKTELLQGLLKKETKQNKIGAAFTICLFGIPEKKCLPSTVFWAGGLIYPEDNYRPRDRCSELITYPD